MTDVSFLELVGSLNKQIANTNNLDLVDCISDIELICSQTGYILLSEVRLQL